MLFNFKTIVAKHPKVTGNPS